MNLNLPKLRSARTLDGVGVGVCLALTALVFVVGVRPLLARRERVRQQRVELARQRGVAEDLETSRQTMREQLHRAREAVDDQALRLLPRRARNRRLGQIARLAEQSGLMMDRLRPGQANPTRHYRAVSIQLTSEGSYRSAVKFLHALHAEVPDVAVRRFNLQRQANGEGAALKLTLTWYAAPGSPEMRQETRAEQAGE